MNRQAKAIGKRNEYAPFRRPVELSHDEPGQGDGCLKRFDLANRVLARCGIENEQRRVRSVLVQFLEDPRNFLEFRHESRFVLQTPRSIDQEYIRSGIARSL